MATNKDITILQGSAFSLPVRWMNAIPEPVLTLFGTVMLGYVISRGYEKTKGIK